MTDKEAIALMTRIERHGHLMVMAIVCKRDSNEVDHLNIADTRTRAPYFPVRDAGHWEAIERQYT